MDTVKIPPMERLNYPTNGLVMVFGSPRSGRTTLAMDLALRVKALTLRFIVYSSRDDSDFRVPWVEKYLRDINDVPDEVMAKGWIFIVDGFSPDEVMMWISSSGHLRFEKSLVILVFDTTSKVPLEFAVYCQRLYYIPSEPSDFSRELCRIYSEAYSMKIEEVEKLLSFLHRQGPYMSVCFDPKVGRPAWFRANPGKWVIRHVSV